MANSCGYTASTIQDLADRLCDVQGNLNDSLQTVLDQVNVILDQIGGVQTGDDRIFQRVVALMDRLGDPGGSTNIDAKINTLQTGVDEANEDTDLIINTVGIRTGTELSILGSVWDYADNAPVKDRVNLAVSQTINSGGSVGQLLGNVLLAVFGGGSVEATVLQTLLATWNAPPLDLLSAASPVSLTTNTDIAIASGVYGYVLRFTVPSYWGIRAGTPVEYNPFIARAAFVGDFGQVDSVVHIIAPVAQVYPIPSGARHLLIHLEPAITGTYEALRFLG